MIGRIGACLCSLASVSLSALVSASSFSNQPFLHFFLPRLLWCYLSWCWRQWGRLNWIGSILFWADNKQLIHKLPIINNEIENLSCATWTQIRWWKQNKNNVTLRIVSVNGCPGIPAVIQHFNEELSWWRFNINEVIVKTKVNLTLQIVLVDWWWCWVGKD